MSISQTPPDEPFGGGDGGHDDILDQFDAAPPAAEFAPLQRGVYTALAVNGRLDQADTGTDCYVVEFQVIEGEYAGRRLWFRRYFTPKALPYTKRDLAKLGIDSRAKLERPFPANRLVCRLTVAVREKDGIRRNEVTNAEVIRILDPADDPAGRPNGDDTSFPFGANEVAL